MVEWGRWPNRTPPLPPLANHLQALDAAAWMAGISTVRPKPERFQPDVDISAGYMHAGYPM